MQCSIPLCGRVATRIAASAGFCSQHKDRAVAAAKRDGLLAEANGRCDVANRRSVLDKSIGFRMRVGLPGRPASWRQEARERFLAIAHAV